MLGRFGILSISLGVVMMTATSGSTTQFVGLGLWWFGVLLLVHSLLGGGRTASFLWASGIAAAVVVYVTGWATMVTEGAGRLVVAALSVLLVVPTLVRSTRPSRRTAAPRHTADGRLRAALACWEVARNQLAAGQPLRAGLTYQDGINHILTCVSLTRLAEERTTASPRPDDLVPVYHAMGAMGREGIPVMEQVNATTPVRFHARMTLAAAHLADPAEGKPELIKDALAADADSSPRPDLNGDGPLSAEARIAGAAEARSLLARLMVERPGLRWEAEPPWLIGSGGPLPFARERKRFRQAVLPSCAGLTPDEEMRQLAQESVLMYTELCQAVPGYESNRDEAKDILAAIRA
ncbi:hypothetical protein [Actinophytocola algeriensis]|uniref:Uncharacterized protein n=2 Tax=Actinophytocola algeriensis TaxID=1768010 RepID=A0A7W7VFU5_9PSEU|nr:hypothetical protein [Actinophytocola algeriensis]MBB4908742.1 hypothetical protein [Actinophytocola algeriensis]